MIHSVSLQDKSPGFQDEGIRPADDQSASTALDPRVQRSREQLRQSLASLLLERTYDSVSIRDITGRAQVGYATFFRHYADKDALLIDLLTESNLHLQALLPPGLGTTPAHEGTMIFEYIAGAHHVYRILLQGEGTQQMLDQIRDAAVIQVMNRFQARPQSAIPLEVAATHLVDSIIALIRWWLRNDMPYSPAQMGEYYVGLVSERFQPFLEPRTGSTPAGDAATS